MKILDLQLLPRVTDSLSFLYVERVRIEQEASAIVLVDEDGRTSVPIAALSSLMLGPGTTVTHAAMVACADAGCSVLFCGEQGVRFYAMGLGDTRRAGNLLHQAKVWADESTRMEVVRRMYAMRFSGSLKEELTLEQVRGMEGVRVRGAYARASKEFGVPWSGRNYSGDWSASTPVNRALSSANACLYGLCHAAVTSIGLSPGIGFVHTGKVLAFVYDVADLYKVEVTVPLAFRESRGSLEGLDSRVRRACRDAFRNTKLIERIVPDVQRVLGLREDEVKLVEHVGPEPEDLSLWGPGGEVRAARNYGEDEDRAHVLNVDEG